MRHVIGSHIVSDSWIVSDMMVSFLIGGPLNWCVIITPRVKSETLKQLAFGISNTNNHCLDYRVVSIASLGDGNAHAC